MHKTEKNNADATKNATKKPITTKTNATEKQIILQIIQGNFVGGAKI